MTDAKQPTPRPSMKAGCLGCLGLLVIGFVIVVAIIVATGAGAKPTVDVGISSSVLQSDCHGLVEARIGSGVVYSGEQVVADHKGKGPDMVASGYAAQNGVRYGFICSGTATTDGTVKAETLAGLAKE